MQITQILADLVAEALESAQAASVLPAAGEVDIKIERPKLAEHGDFSTSLPLTLARTMRVPPIQIATAIVDAMPQDEMIGSVASAPPGFVNFTLSMHWLQSQVNIVRSLGEKFGAVDSGLGKSVQVEFVSVNPTGPLHVGHARGAVIGSSLANVLEAAGYEVQREYYVNDAGTQMRVFYDTLYSRYMQASGRDVPLPDPSYPGEYLSELASDLLNDLGDAAVHKEKTDAIADLAPESLRRTIDGIRHTLERLGVVYDQWFYESGLISSGRFDQVMDFLKDSNLIVDRDGAQWFAATKLGLDEDFIFDADEAVSDPSSGSAKVLQTTVDGIVQRRLSQQAKVQTADAKRAAEESSFRSRHNVSDADFNDLLDYAKNNKLTLDDIYYLKNRESKEDNIAKSAQTEVIEQMKNVRKTPKSASATGGESSSDSEITAGAKGR